MSDFWVVVADENIARFFATDKIRVELNEREVLTNPDARLRERKLQPAAPGRSFNSRGQARHAMEPPSSRRESHARKFARAIGARIEEGFGNRSYERLILIAPPDFLGLLRRQLPDAAQKRVTLELAKELTREKPEEIIRHIAQARGVY